MKKILLLLIIFLIPLAYAITECSPTTEIENIPCQVTSTWNYTAPCNSHTVRYYNTSGVNIQNFTFGNYGDTGLCFFIWNYTIRGSYSGIVDNGDTLNITIGGDNLQLSLVIGIGITIATLLFLAFKIDNDHKLLQLGLIFFSVALISLIPAVLIIDTANIIFHRLVMGFIIVFWLYVATYLVYFILKKAGIIVAGER